MKVNNEKGIALIFTLLLVIVLLSISVVFILRTVQESNIARKERDMMKAFYLAEAGGQAGLDGLNTLINNFMLNTVNGMNPSTVINLAQTSLSNGLKLLESTVLDGGSQAITLNASETEATFQIAGVGLGDGNYSYDITITEKSNPVIVTPDTWDFPYDYLIQLTSNLNTESKEVVLRGDFTVRVQRDNFAKYALFTNSQTMPNGSYVWFTDKTNFAGPIHTNGRYNIALNPSGTFDGVVAQHSEYARYYNNGWSVLLNDDHNGTNDVPTFNAGFNRDVDTITLSSAVDQQDMEDQATSGTSFGSDGIYTPNNGSSLTGGIYVRGDSQVILNITADDKPQYTIIQGGTTKNITLDKANNQTTVETVGVGSITYSGLPDGSDDVGTIIYVDGRIQNFQGTVQSQEKLTVASDDDILVKGHVKYADYDPGSGSPGDGGYIPPNANGAENLLGIVSWNGDVRVATSAPDDINIHASILARNGILQVDNYNDQGVGPRGEATILGGVISDNYGAFGQFSGSTGQQLSGYGRNFVYDQRMQTGTAPPYFPTLNTFIAFTNDITDKMVWQENGS
ncbi:MAG: DUF4900 domain-containing protein [Candidatus Omnitrophica bacterium]|nr:DUF4900 domain-containing protein [Candidatus Omnitrophota bacterium]